MCIRRVPKNSQFVLNPPEYLKVYQIIQCTRGINFYKI